MKTLLFVYNPYSGKGRAASELSDIVSTLTTEGYLVTTYPTQGAGDAGDSIIRWGAVYDRIVVAGGDGTLNDAVRGLMALPDAPPLGYLPLGSTNDFSRNLSLPSALLDQVKVAGAGVLRPCDAARFNGRPFIYIAAFGAFTDVSFTTPQRTKNMLGHTAYVLESIKRLPTIRPQEITVEHDSGTITGLFLYGMVSNSRSVAGLSQFPPGNPELNDGLLELTLISPPRDILEMESFVRLLLTGNMVPDHDMMNMYSTSYVKISAGSEVLWTLDGENGGMHTEAEIQVLPSAFQIAHGE